VARTRTDLAEIAHEAAAMRGRGTPGSITVDAGGPAVATGDAPRLRQIVSDFPENAQAAHVLECFYRGTPPGRGDAAPRSEGSGLGLAIVRTISEARGVVATLTSRAARGQALRSRCRSAKR
jgi:hypothetical protein